MAFEDSARPGENAAAAFERVYSFTEQKLVEKFQQTEDELKADN